MTDQRDLTALRRVQDALLNLTRGLAPFVEARLAARHGPRWREAVQRAGGARADAPSDAYALLKTLTYWWADTFRDAFDGADRHKARSLVTLALDARNATAHAAGGMDDADALRALDAIHELLRLTEAPAAEIAAVKVLYDAQRHAGTAEQVLAKPAALVAAAAPRSGSNADRILAHIRAQPGLDDDELSRHLGITPRQTVNQIARKLEAEGLIARVPGPRNKIVNRPAKAKP